MTPQAHFQTVQPRPAAGPNARAETPDHARRIQELLRRDRERVRSHGIRPRVIGTREA